VSFFLYFYAVKTKITILLFFIFALNLRANVPEKTESQLQDYITSKVIAQQNNDASIINTPIVIDNEPGGISTSGKREKLHSILAYSIFIFLSVLIIILIDNRNLEKRYKKLAADFKIEDPFL